MLETIKQTENNIEIQILYLEIISLACTDASSKYGIAKYQNKVLSEFFSPNSNALLKGLIHFTLVHEGGGHMKPYISFSKDKSISDEAFLTYNPRLTQNMELEEGSPHFTSQDGKILYSLETLSKHAGNKESDLILEYIYAVLQLNFRLCRGRNLDAIDKVQSIGLTHSLIYSSMQNERINIKVKTAFILLYEVLFLDIQPFYSITQNTNKCYM